MSVIVQNIKVNETFRQNVRTVGDLKKSGYQMLPVREEMRAKLLCLLAAGVRILPGIIG